jgi:DNA-binding transcriptional MerR regulator
MSSTGVVSVGFDDSKAEGRSYAKSKLAFRTIGEAAVELDVEQHVLRFWESRFSQIRPIKRGGGRRYYRPEDLDLLRRIRSLLYEQGYTIKGVQRLLKEGRGRPAASRLDARTTPDAAERPTPDAPPPRPAAKLDGGQRQGMEAVVGDLRLALEELHQTLYRPR